MSAEDSNKLEKMFEKRFSNPFKHRLLEAFYGYPKFRAQILGYLRAPEGAILRYWASQLSPKSIILEVGTFQGLSTAYLCSGARKSDSTVYSIDPFDQSKDKQRKGLDGSKYLDKKVSKEQVERNLIRQGIPANRFNLMAGFSQEVEKDWTLPIDFLWIDANHLEALQDYEAWRKHLHKGSRVAFHDASPKYSSFPKVISDVKTIIAREKIRELEKVKSIVSFVLEK